MALSNYSDLKAAIIDELDRDDLADKVDDFIQLAEAKHRDGDEETPPIRFRDMLKRAQAEFVGRYLALPDGFLQMRTLRLLTTPRISIVEEINLDEMNRKRQECDAPPRYFAVHEELEFDTDPEDLLTAEMIYYAALTPLSDTDPINALLTRSPGCYLYGALAAAAPWLSEDERIATWQTLYKGAAFGVIRADRASRHGGPLVSRVAGIMP